MLGRNAACPGENAQPRGGSYGGRGGQITWWAGVPQTGGNRGEGYQMGPQRNPNVIDVDRGMRGDRKCYHCGKFV